jgi:RNA polymerase sigma-70 factor (ECF subfamily)
LGAGVKARPYDRTVGRAKTVTTSRFTGQVVPRSGKQLTHIVRVMVSCNLFISQIISQIKYILHFFVINLFKVLLYLKTIDMKSLKDEFLEILSNYQGILHKVNLVYFRNKSEREENFQEIIYQLWESFPRLQNKKSIGSWIYAVSINTAISKIKKDARIEYRETLPEITDMIDIEEEFASSETYRILLQAIYNLNEIDKSIMLLYLEEKTYDEISEIIGISTSNVGVRINRAKELLKQNLKI